VAFFQKVRFVFQISKKKCIPKNYLEIVISISRLLQYTVIGGKFKFKFQVQDSFWEYFFWRFEKHIALSEKKPPLVLTYLLATIIVQNSG
jgi:hypothetical protein